VQERAHDLTNCLTLPASQRHQPQQPGAQKQGAGGDGNLRLQEPAVPQVIGQATQVLVSLRAGIVVNIEAVASNIVNRSPSKVYTQNRPQVQGAERSAAGIAVRQRQRLAGNVQGAPGEAVRRTWPPIRPRDGESVGGRSPSDEL
jgi:hypothetical protein